MGKRLRVMFVIGSLSIGGAETQLVRLMGSLDRERYEPVLCCLAEGGLLEEQVRRLQIPYHICDLTFSGKRAILRTLVGFIRFYLLLWRYRPTILHCFLYTANVIGALLGRLALVPIIITSRRSLGLYKDERWFLQPIENVANVLTDIVTVNSRRVWDDVLRGERVRPDRIRLTYNGVPVEHATLTPRQLRERLPIPADARVIMCVANLFQYKGHRDLLHAFARVKETCTEPCVLVLVGRDSGELAPLQALAAELHLTDYVIFTGQRSDARELVSACDIAVLASHQEGFSNSILEAMAAGRPHVVTDVGGNAEAVQDGVCGLVVPPRAPADMATALGRLLQDSELRARMGEAAQQRARGVFSMEQATLTVREVYREQLERKRPRLARSIFPQAKRR